MSVIHDQQATQEPAPASPRNGRSARAGGSAGVRRLRPGRADARRRHPGGVDVRRLWSGGAASAVVAGLAALVGVLVSRWLFSVPVLAPGRDGAPGDAGAAVLILVAAAAALAATGLAHLLMVSTPRPLIFFGWIVALVTTLAVVYPFSAPVPLGTKLATAVVDLAIGAMIGMLVGGAAARSTTRPPSWRSDR